MFSIKTDGCGGGDDEHDCNVFDMLVLHMVVIAMVRMLDVS